MMITRISTSYSDFMMVTYRSDGLSEVDVVESSGGVVPCVIVHVGKTSGVDIEAVTRGCQVHVAKGVSAQQSD
jgi:hypothetical protein